MFRKKEGGVKREGENFSPLSRSERFAFFKDVARRRESKGKEKGTARRGEINQKHLSTLVDSGRGRVGSLSLSLSSRCQPPSRQWRRSFVSAAALFNG